jgi:YVTN family beta-propeller protein
MPLRPVRPLLAAAVALWLAPALRANTSNSLLDVSPDGKLLLAANADNGSVTVVDTAERKALREIPVGRKPEGVTWIGNGPLAAVTLYDDNAVAIFDAQTGRVVRKIPVAHEPYGIVADRAGRRAWVTQEYPATVTEIDLQAQKVARTIKVGSFLRGIALAPDEKRLYVTEFYSGILHAVDLDSGKAVDSWKGHSTDNLARHVVLHPSRPKAYLSHIRSMVHVIDGGGSIFPQLSICDLKPGTGRRRTSFGMDTYNGVYVVTNAWEAAVSPDGKRIYTVYAGTNDMNVSDVVDDDYSEIRRVGRAVRVGQNPRAVRVSPDGRRVYIYNTLDFEVSFHDRDMRPQGKVKVCGLPPTKTPEWVRGKILFNTANYPLSQRRWIACASCHPDGHHDGRTWQNPEGLRKTTALFGVAHTHPLHWSADRDEVQDFEYTIRSPLMAGRGLLPGPIQRKRGFEKVELKEKLSGRSKDLDALAIYTNSFEFIHLSPHIPAPGKLSPAAERGKKLFFSKEVGCAKCHSGPYYTDSTLKEPYNLHDVGTGDEDKSERMGKKYDTPSLLGIYRTPPYLHHGKAKTLHDVLTTCNKNDRHGKTSHLKPNEIDDLVEFLRSLPYEQPPDTTPNTVPFRVQPAKQKATALEADRVKVTLKVEEKGKVRVQVKELPRGEALALLGKEIQRLRQEAKQVEGSLFFTKGQAQVQRVKAKVDTDQTWRFRGFNADVEELGRLYKEVMDLTARLDAVRARIREYQLQRDALAGP